MTEDELAAIEARLAFVTRSLPWENASERAHRGIVQDAAGEVVAYTHCGHGAHAPVIADVLAHAPTDLARLLAEVRRLRAAEALREREARATEALRDV